MKLIDLKGPCPLNSQIGLDTRLKSQTGCPSSNYW